jgi:hypothetical protein
MYLIRLADIWSVSVHISALSDGAGSESFSRPSCESCQPGQLDNLALWFRATPVIPKAMTIPFESFRYFPVKSIVLLAVAWSTLIRMEHLFQQFWIDVAVFILRTSGSRLDMNE